MSASILKELWKVFLVTLIFLIIVEILIRVTYFIRNSMVDYVALPYVIGHRYGPQPPWTDSLRILEKDKALIWKNRPNLRRRYIDVFNPMRTEQERLGLIRQFFPALPDSLKKNLAWMISLNSQGFRDAEFPSKKPSSVFRIICVGDSWTFGANVSQDQTYPQFLKALLSQEFPGGDFEVFNLGVLGYSSYQGLRLLRRKVSELGPDLVVIAFAMNDSSVAGYRDKDMPARNKSTNVTKNIGRFLEKIESYKLLRYWVQVIKYEPKTIEHHLKARADAATRKEEAVDYEELEAWTRVSPRDYRNNILEMIDLARSHDASLILLYNQLSGDAGEVAGIGQLGVVSPYLRVLEEISRMERVPLVDSSALIAKARTRLEKELESKLELRSLGAQGGQTKSEIEVIFRVYLGKLPVSKAVYIVGAHPKLGDLVPNKITMYDDGTHGDQKAGDAVWSYAATFSKETQLFYVYTNSGKEGKWEGLDVPYIRSCQVIGENNQRSVYRPIDRFGKIYMQADSWHTNSAGYELIAKAILGKLKKEGTVKKYLAEIAAK